MAVKPEQLDIVQTFDTLEEYIDNKLLTGDYILEDREYLRIDIPINLRKEVNNVNIAELRQKYIAAGWKSLLISIHIHTGEAHWFLLGV